MNHEDDNMSLISSLSERLLNGVFKENPTFVLMLGMCPTLAVTTSAINGLGMGVSTMVVLAMSNLIISLLRKLIPDKIRIPAFIVIIASFVTIVELVMKGYIPSLYNALGLYIPLIVVNCIILGRAESYAYSHPALLSLFDGLGMGMGFTLALTIIGAFRELLGSGKIFNAQVMPAGFIPVSIFVMAPGAFFVLAMLTAIQNKIKEIGTAKGKDMSKIQSGCGGDCMSCTKECKVDLTAVSEDTEDVAVESTKDASSEPVSDQSFAERLKKRFERKHEETGSEIEESDQVDGETGGESNEPGEQSDSKADDSEHTESEPEPVEEPSGAVESSVESIEEPVNEPEESATEQEEHTEEPEEPVAEPAESVTEREELKEELPEVKEEPVNAEESSEEPSEETSESPESEDETVDDADNGVEMWNISNFTSPVKKEIPSGKRPEKSRKAFERAKAMLDKAEGAAKEENHD